jgi:hypothetical protein
MKRCTSKRDNKAFTRCWMLGWSMNPSSAPFVISVPPSQLPHDKRLEISTQPTVALKLGTRWPTQETPQIDGSPAFSRPDARAWCNVQLCLASPQNFHVPDRGQRLETEPAPFRSPGARFWREGGIACAVAALRGSFRTERATQPSPQGEERRPACQARKKSPTVLFRDRMEARDVGKTKMNRLLQQQQHRMRLQGRQEDS